MKTPRGATIPFLVLSVIVAVGCASAPTPRPTPIPTRAATPTAVPLTATAVPPTITPVPTLEPSTNRKKYSNAGFGASLQYPSAWQPVAGNERRFAGADGFFQVDAISGNGLTIDDVADSEAHHKLQPYGSEPTIEKWLAAGREARLILPSADQPKEMNRQAGLIVELPKPIEMGGQRYDYLVLWADLDHIREIAGTLRLD